MADPVYITGRDQSTITVVGSTALGTGVGATLVIDTADSNGLTLQFRAGGTAGGVIVVEGTLNDGNANTWTALPLKPTTGGPSLVTGTLTTLAANTTYRYEIPTFGISKVRLRVTTALGAALNDLSYVAHPESTDTFGVVAQTGTWNVSTVPQAAGSSYALTTAASTNAAVVKSSAGNLLSLNVFNNTAALIHVKFYEKTTAPAPATDSPVLVVPVAVNASVNLNFGAIGERFATGIAIAVVANASNTDATAVAAGAKIKATYI